MTLSRLEDFGVRTTVSPEDRLAEYKKQKLSAKQWQSALEHDPEVAKLVGFKKLRRRV